MKRLDVGEPLETPTIVSMNRTHPMSVRLRLSVGSAVRRHMCSGVYGAARKLQECSKLETALLYKCISIAWDETKGRLREVLTAGFGLRAEVLISRLAVFHACNAIEELENARYAGKRNQ